MKYEDYLNYFETLVICYYHDNYKYTTIKLKSE